MRPSLVGLFATLLILGPATGTSAPAAAQRPPAKTGQCLWVHGRFLVYNGSSVQRIWIVGTRRLVALSDDDPGVPGAILAYEQASSGSEQGARDGLWADFRVCALEDNKPGHMQRVRVTGVRNGRFHGRPFPPR